MKKSIYTSVFALFLFCEFSQAQSNESDKSSETKIYTEAFPSLDQLEITAKIYEIDKNAPTILLCHQARFNKFEYEGIAQRLNEKGFNCIAIDQRSGGPIANAINETTVRAVKAGKSIEYLDAEQDMIAAIDFAANKYNKPIILWGSSYSSTLTMYIGPENKNVSAVVAFSPGNYFADKKGSLIDKLAGFEKPMFVTSSKKEAPDIVELLANVKLNKNQIHFTPEGEGHHGSRALWETQNGGEEYWEAIGKFLDGLASSGAVEK